MIEQGLKEGGLGIGVVPGYAPRTGYKELLAVQTLAANYKVPTYWHVRSEGDVDPLSAAEAYGEVISFAAATDSHVHICHLNSTSFRDIGLAVRMIDSAQRQGLNITVEAYPYGAASTAIGAAVLASDNLSRAGMAYESIEYRGTLMYLVPPLRDQILQLIWKRAYQIRPVSRLTPGFPSSPILLTPQVCCRLSTYYRCGQCHHRCSERCYDIGYANAHLLARVPGHGRLVAPISTTLQLFDLYRKGYAS
jgi:hypothetical protein